MPDLFLSSTATPGCAAIGAPLIDTRSARPNLRRGAALLRPISPRPLRLVSIRLFRAVLGVTAHA